MIKLVDWNSPLWNELRGAYGGEGITNDLKIIVGVERAEDEEEIMK